MLVQQGSLLISTKEIYHRRSRTITVQPVTRVFMWYT